MADLYFPLPEEILDNVVIWLPTKSFFRFKCVSKHWNKVIPNYFMKVRPGRRTFMLPVQPFHAIDNMVPYDHIDHVISKTFCSPFGNLEGKKVIFVGTYNGILLLAFKNQFPGHMMLYNPFTEEYEMVPDPPLCDDRFNYNYGLGYTTTLDELKIFVFRHVRADERVGLPNGKDTCCHVFSFKDRSWSIISLWVWEDDEYELWDDQYKYDFIHDAGTFMNGFLYWPVSKSGFGRLLLALDLKHMRFSEIKFPPKHGLRKKKKKKLTSNFPFTSIILGILDGCPCIVSSNCSKLEVWVSNTQEFGECWEKRYSSTLVSRGNSLYKFEPFSIFDDGKIVMLKRPNQVMILDIYNDSYKEARKTVTTLYEISGTQAIEYMETYLSPYDICSRLEDNEQDTEGEVLSSLEDNKQDTQLKLWSCLENSKQDIDVEFWSSLEHNEQDTDVEVCSSLEDEEQDAEEEVSSSLEDEEQDTGVEVSSSLEDEEQDNEVEVSSSLEYNEEDTEVEVSSSLEDEEQDTEVEVSSSLENNEQDTKVEVSSSLEDEEQDTEVEVSSSLEDEEQDTKVEVSSSLEDNEQETEVDVSSSLEEVEV